MTSQPKSQSNGENFTSRTYMGVSILVRDKDGYVNASKMGTASRRARKCVNEDKKFAEICDVWSSQLKRPVSGTSEESAKYQLFEGYRIEVRGTYVHPDLVHFVAEWVDLKYAFVVQKIMNSLDTQLHNIMEDNGLSDEPVVAKRLLDSASVELKVKGAEIEELKVQVKELQIDNQVLGLKKKKLSLKLKRLEDEKFDRDVRTNLCDRNVRILMDDGTYYFSANHEKRYKKLDVVYQFVFPANMNVRRDVRRWMEMEFDRKVETVPSFSADEFQAVVDYIKSLSPKEINEFAYKSE
jgi:hypothetical protein